jgi:hypothetical protein
MSEYDFIVENIRFSHSSTSTFDTCPYAFKLSYIERLPRESNFYAEFGSLIHACLEKYFAGDLEIYELSEYYNSQYDLFIVSPAPEFPYGIMEKYKLQGQSFFDTFSFERDRYEVLLIEGKIDFDLNGNNMVAKPDLVLKEKKTGKVGMYDYKSATPFRNGKKTGKEIVDTKKIEGYYNQMYVYTYALRKYKSIPVDEIILWFTRPDRRIAIPWILETETAAINRISAIIERIKKEEKFSFNNTSQYFCNELCGVRQFCEYR